jgi:CoA:oxalate CoA-transferase
MLEVVDHPAAGPLQVPGIPIKLRDTPGRIASPPPLLGQHTGEVLREMGYSAADIERLRVEGVV